MFSSKKGQIELVGDVIVQLLIAAGVILAFYIFLWASLRGTDLQKRMLSIDQALITNTLFASSGNTLFIYPKIPLNLFYDFAENAVNIYEKGDIIKLQYEYITSPKIKSKQIFNLSVNKTKQLQFLKLANQIKLGVDMEYNEFLEECPIGEKQIIRKIIVMPKKIKEEENPLTTYLFNFRPQITPTDTLSTSEVFDILVEISKNPDPNAISIYIPFNSPLSRRLACLVANQLMQEEEFPNVPIIPSNTELFKNLAQRAPFSAILSLSIGEEYIDSSKPYLPMNLAFQEYSK